MHEQRQYFPSRSVSADLTTDKNAQTVARWLVHSAGCGQLVDGQYRRRRPLHGSGQVAWFAELHFLWCGELTRQTEITLRYLPGGQQRRASVLRCGERTNGVLDELSAVMKTELSFDALAVRIDGLDAQSEELCDCTSTQAFTDQA
jgi:hypothetical protein